MWKCGHQRLDLQRTGDDLTVDVLVGHNALFTEECQSFLSSIYMTHFSLEGPARYEAPES